MPKHQPVAVTAMVEDIARALQKVPDDEFTTPQILAHTSYCRDAKDIATVLSHKVSQKRLVHVGRGRYRRIPGVALTDCLPKGLVLRGVWNALTNNRCTDPQTFPQIVAFTAAYIERPYQRIFNSVNQILHAWVRDGSVICTGTVRGKHRYQLRTGITECPVCERRPAA